jgi:hypothetical protein
MKHVVHPVTGAVEFWHVGSLDEPGQSRARRIVATRLLADRVRGGLVPVPARRDTLLCGCPWGSPVDADGTCSRCSS